MGRLNRAGDSNNLSLKVSPDGTGWTEALTIDRSTGLAPGAVEKSGSTDTTPGRLTRADYGYGPGNLIGAVSQSGGTSTGVVFESGSNADGSYTRCADGTQICWNTKTHQDVDISVVAGGAYRSSIFYESFPVPFVGDPVVNVTGTRASDNWDVWAVVHAVSPQRVSLLHMKLNLNEDQDRTVSFIAIGRWF